MGHQMKRMDAPFRKRMRRRLYYSDMTSMETPSLPLTELAVEYFRESVPQKLGHVDLYMGSNITKKNQVTPCSVVMSMLYAKRLRQRNKQYLQSMSSSDVFFISMMMASKYLYDEGVDEEVFNDEWADNTDQDVDDVNQMEMNFLEAMDWRLFVRPEEFEEALSGIERRLALQEGLKRGWFTYSELSLLADSQMMAGVWTKLGIDCSKLATVFSTAYLAGLLSMLGSVALAVQLSGPFTTITLTLLTIQSSPFSLVASSGVPSLGPAPSVVMPSLPPTLSIKMSEVDESDEEDVGNFDGEMKTGNKPAAHSSCHGSVLSSSPVNREKVLCNTVDDVKRKQTDLDIGNGRNNSKGVDKTPTTLRAERSWLSSATTSLWSVWFVDSLLSQLWSLVSKQKVTEPGDKINLEDSLDRLSPGHDGEANLGRSWRRKRRMGAKQAQDHPTSCIDAGESLIADVHGLTPGGTEDELQEKLDRLSCWQCEDHKDSFLSASTPDLKTRCWRCSDCGGGGGDGDNDKNGATSHFSCSRGKKGWAAENHPLCVGRGCRRARLWNPHSKDPKDVKHEQARSNPKLFASWPAKLQAEAPHYSLGLQLPAIGFFTGS